ncbi:glutamate-rich protein 1 isoform X2 [Pseudophryne corroboree]|uniref:glutamate-rich protein 1 isoform X2 n=1 Tax=Pseudophryne corroboree TaxID=495146 RepID=UPI003081837A
MNLKEATKTASQAPPSCKTDIVSAVFISKVLARLNQGTVSKSSTTKPPDVQLENVTIVRPAKETHVEVVQLPTTFPAEHNPKTIDLEQDGHTRSLDESLNPERITAPADEKGSMSEQKIYTVSLPPDDYASAVLMDVKSSPTEESDLSDDAQAHPVEKRRRRRRKRKVNVMTQCTSDVANSLQQSKHQPQSFERVAINKNKRRKLQRKRQKERLKAAGLWTKAKAGAGQAQTDEVKHCDEQTEEEIQSKTKDLLDFLQATQEIYFTEGKSTCAESVFSPELIEEILDQIKNGTTPLSDLQSLHHLKRLLLLQDIERLKYALHSFKEHSSMPLDHTTALCSLFYYWITNILPIKAKHAI